MGPAVWQTPLSSLNCLCLDYQPESLTGQHVISSLHGQRAFDSDTTQRHAAGSCKEPLPGCNLRRWWGGLPTNQGGFV